MDVNAPEFVLPGHVGVEETIQETESTNLRPISNQSNSFPSFDTSGVDLANYRPDYHYLKYVVTDAGSNQSAPLPVTSVAFDNAEELLWQGNSGGHVASYYTTDMQKYTSFQVHQSDDIRSLLTCDGGLLALTKNQLRLYMRRGLQVFSHESESMKDMQCMTRLPSGLLVMGGQQENMVEFDIERAKIVRVSDIGQSGCVIVRSNPKVICCSDIGGRISLRDHSSLNVLHSFSTHSGQLSDFDVHGNYLVTCGYSTRSGSYISDRFLMVFDLRMNKAISPIGMSFAPYLLRFVPLYSSKFCVVSQSGKFQLMDTSGSLIPPPYLHEITMPMNSSIVSMDVSSSCQSLAFGNDAGCLQLMGTSQEAIFNNLSQPTEFADEPERVTSIAFDDMRTSFSAIPVPPNFGDGTVLSDWPNELTKKVYRIPRPISEDILKNMKMKDSVGYVTNPRTSKRNQCVYDLRDTQDERSSPSEEISS
ncbi:PAN2-PAN3 deadenylation complex catalytic subunit Pan2 [Halotydeus destructor]|nr:PAN2-PAN3 deadenylation complex catalytic subunit Pan2 [Halotydeus destructor]